MSSEVLASLLAGLSLDSSYPSLRALRAKILDLSRTVGDIVKSVLNGQLRLFQKLSCDCGFSSIWFSVREIAKCDMSFWPINDSSSSS